MLVLVHLMLNDVTSSDACKKFGLGSHHLKSCKIVSAIFQTVTAKGLFIWERVVPVGEETLRHVYKRDLAFLQK
mgnify:CR=1 FL=1